MKKLLLTTAVCFACFILTLFLSVFIAESYSFDNPISNILFILLFAEFFVFPVLIFIRLVKWLREKADRSVPVVTDMIQDIWDATLGNNASVPQEPVFQEPVSQEPVSQEPVSQEPVYQEAFIPEDLTAHRVIRSRNDFIYVCASRLLSRGFQHIQFLQEQEGSWGDLHAMDPEGRPCLIRCLWQTPLYEALEALPAKQDGATAFMLMADEPLTEKAVSLAQSRGVTVLN